MLICNFYSNSFLHTNNRPPTLPFDPIDVTVMVAISNFSKFKNNIDKYVCPSGLPSMQLLMLHILSMSSTESEHADHDVTLHYDHQNFVVSTPNYYF